VHWIHLAQDIVQQWTLVNTVMGLLVHLYDVVKLDPILCSNKKSHSINLQIIKKGSIHYNGIISQCRLKNNI
jgi:hypothetical protein